jgi:hypothetical protein
VDAYSLYRGSAFFLWPGTNPGLRFAIKIKYPETMQLVKDSVVFDSDQVVLGG